MANTLYNPAQGAVLYTAAGVGTASGEFTSVKNGGGAVVGVVSTSLLDGVAKGGVDKSQISVGTVRGLGNGVLAVGLDSEISGTVIGSSGTPAYVAISGIDAANNVVINALSVGSYLYVNPGTSAVAPGSSVNMLYSTQKISAMASATGYVVTNLPYNVVYSGLSVCLRPLTSTWNWNTQTAGKYVGQKMTTQLAGVANTALAFGSNNGQLTRSINKVASVRTTKLTTALRAGSFNCVTGKWSAVPTLSSDGAITNSTITSDKVGSPSMSAPGSITYNAALLNKSTSTTYSARTTW